MKLLSSRLTQSWHSTWAYEAKTKSIKHWVQMNCTFFSCLPFINFYFEVKKIEQLAETVVVVGSVLEEVDCVHVTL